MTHVGYGGESENTKPYENFEKMRNDREEQVN